jgi:hypothetical protein
MRTIFFIVLLATTFINCNDNNGKIIGGDDHDYVPHGLIGGDDHDKVAYQYLQLKAMLKERSLENLRSYCLKLESYSREKSGKIILGGLHDYIDSMDRNDCMDYISTSVMQNRELLEKQKLLSVIAPEELIIGGDGHDEKAYAFINLKNTWTDRSLGELKDYCLRVEKYVNSKKSTPVFGGLHDYIFRMNKDACIEYLSKAVLDNEELLNNNTFYSVATPQMIIGGDDHDEIAYKFLQLKKSLKANSKEELKSYCLKLEKYVNSKRDEPMMGGIHDYIDKLSKEDMMSYISEVTLNNQELLDAQKFKAVVTEKEVIVKAGGHHDIVAFKYLQLKAQLKEKSLEELKDYSLRLEKYVNEKNGVELIGGLHDYIGTWKQDNCIEYISKVVLNNEELLEQEKFFSVVSPVEQLTLLEEGLIGGGLHDYIRTLDRETLLSFAYTCEQFKFGGKKRHIRGGFAEYGRKLTNEQIGTFILDQADRFPELNNIERLQQLSLEYGFTQ